MQIKQKNNIHKKIYGSIAFISFFLAIGTVGAFEQNAISFTEAIIRAVVFLLTCIIFTKLAGGFEYYGGELNGKIHNRENQNIKSFSYRTNRRRIRTSMAIKKFNGY